MATCYTLFFVPVMYSLLRRKPPKPEAVDDDEAAEPAKTPSTLVTGEVGS
jgi:hypothetical protein